MNAATTDHQIPDMTSTAPRHSQLGQHARNNTSYACTHLTSHGQSASMKSRTGPLWNCLGMWRQSTGTASMLRNHLLPPQLAKANDGTTTRHDKESAVQFWPEWALPRCGSEANASTESGQGMAQQQLCNFGLNGLGRKYRQSQR